MKPLLDVLVVEDDELMRRVLVRALRDDGRFRVKSVRSCGMAAVVRGTFDVGVFDVHLGDGSGIELAAQLQAAGRVQRVVFFTAGASQLERAEAQHHGTYVDKAEGLQGLLEAVLAR